MRKPHPNDPAKAERAMLDGLVDAAVLATTDMRVLFVNRQLLKLTGYASEQVVGQNVTMLMPPDVAKNHASYVDSYLRTGNAKVIGKGREVSVRQKDGTLVSCWLSVTEQKKNNGRHTFMGTLHEMHTKLRDNRLTSFSVLDALQRVVLVIDVTGTLKASRFSVFCSFLRFFVFPALFRIVLTFAHSF